MLDAQEEKRKRDESEFFVVEVEDCEEERGTKKRKTEMENVKKEVLQSTSPR